MVTTPTTDGSNRNFKRLKTVLSSILSRQGEVTSIGDVVSLTGFSRSSVTRILNGLVKFDLVYRDPKNVEIPSNAAGHIVGI